MNRSIIFSKLNARVNGHGRPLAIGGAVALVFLLSLTGLYAQTEEAGNIQGTIIDKRGGTPLVEQRVVLTIHTVESAVTEETFTDDKGNYTFGNLSLNPSVHYTVSTVHEGTDYTEADIVLSSWAPRVTVDIEIGAFTDDETQVRVQSHTFIIGPPPADHAPDGAVTVVEAISIENLSDQPFRTTRGGEKVGLYLSMPERIEGFQQNRSPSIGMNAAGNEVISTTSLPPGETHFSYTYIFHVENNRLDLSRRLNFGTSEFLFFIPMGIDFVPNGKFFGTPSREEIHGNVYTIYRSNVSTGFAAGASVDLALNVNMGGVRSGLPAEETPDLGQLILIAVAAALAGGFFVAALFKLRSENKSTESEAIPPSDAGWLRKLSSDDREHVRMARLEFITQLDDKYGRQEISERVYKRLRREQTDRLTTLLEEEKRENDA